MTTTERLKHIVLVIRILNGRSGGAERIYCELANLLQVTGHRVTCLHYDGKSGEPFYTLDPQVERINLHERFSTKRKHVLAAASKFFPRPLRERLEWNMLNGFFLRQLNDYFRLVKPDIAISILPPANTPTLLAARDTSVQVIACNHNVPKEDYENPQRWSQNGLDRQLRLSALDHSAALHVLFPTFGTWFPQHLQSRIVAIPNYISSSFAMPEPPPVREKTVLAVGRLADVKNYIDLIRAWALISGEFPDWTVRIIGSGPQRDELQQEIARLKLKDRIVLAGQCSELSEEYARASLFCHPALYEGFGLSVAEALSLRCPVVFFGDCAGVQEFVRDGYNGLAVERQQGTAGLAAALARLMRDKPLRHSLGANGPDSVCAFSLGEYKARWLHLIDSLEGTARDNR